MPPQFFEIPNLPYLLASFAHLLGMTVWIGGGGILGAVGAPVLFRRLPREQAGALFGAMLHIFEKISLGAAALAVGGAIARALIGGQNPNAWIYARDGALGLMVLALLAANFSVHPRIRALQAAAKTETPEFERLHRLSERLMKAQIVLGLVVILFA